MFRRVIASGLYIFVWFLALALLVNLGALVQELLFSWFNPFFKAVIGVPAVSTIVLFALVPFVIYPFGLITRMWSRRETIRLSILFAQTPAAYMQCVRGVMYAVFTFLTVALPILLGFGTLAAAVAQKSGHCGECITVGIAAFLLLVLLRQQLLSRFLVPLVTVVSGQSVRFALGLSLELTRRKFRLILTVVLAAVIGLVLVGFITPIDRAELTSLCDGSVLASLSAWHGRALLKILPLIAYLVVSLFAVFSILAGALVDRQIRRLDDLLDANVSSLMISKLAKAGYFS